MSRLALWRACCPFFGTKPEALLLLEFDQGGLSFSFEDTLASSLKAASTASTRELRWTLGLSSRFFVERLDRGKVPPPKGLRPLHFKGDERFRPGLKERPGHILAAVGGHWDDVLGATQSLRDLLTVHGCPIVAVNIGYCQGTDRDPTGFIDGTSNLQDLDEDAFCRCVFVQPEDDPFLAGATYVVLRKYEEDLCMWNTLSTAVQEQMIGRRKYTGAFLNDSPEWIPEAWERTPVTAHIRRAHPRSADVPPKDIWRERIYRRSIPYQESRMSGTVSTGVLFLSLVRDPHAQVERIHNERLLPEEGTKDYFLDSGYVTPKRSVSYLIPSSMTELLHQSVCPREMGRPGQ